MQGLHAIAIASFAPDVLRAAMCGAANKRFKCNALSGAMLRTGARDVKKTYICMRFFFAVAVGLEPCTHGCCTQMRRKRLANGGKWLVRQKASTVTPIRDGTSGTEAQN